MNFLRELSESVTAEDRVRYGELEYTINLRGKKYFVMVDEQVEEDVKKLYYTVIDSDGNAKSFDWSPYAPPTEGDVRLWIQLGMPDRITNGPLTREDLRRLAQEKLVR